MKKLNDDELVRLIKKDVEKGMQIVVRDYGGLVHTICQNLLTGVPKEDIEETIIDTYIKFWRQIKDEATIVLSVRNYIAGIARYSAIDKLRLLKKDKHVLNIDEDFYIGIDIDMENEVAKKINSEITNKVINEMPDFEREIFIRKYFLYQKTKEIAAKMNISSKKVENILYRYKIKLKTKLKESGVIL